MVADRGTGPIGSGPMTRLLALLMFLAACGGNGEPPPEGCTDPVAATTVELADFAFLPDCFSADAGATITLENTGDALHTFTVEGTDVDVDVDAGTSTETTLSGVEPGTHAVTCTLHPQMEATLTVG
jgi:plastocyanin